MVRIFARAGDFPVTTAICRRCKSALSEDGDVECPQCGALVGAPLTGAGATSVAADSRRLWPLPLPFARAAGHYASTPDDIIAPPPRRWSRWILLIAGGVAGVVMGAIIGEWFMDPLSMPNRPSPHRNVEPAVSAKHEGMAQIPASSAKIATPQTPDLNAGGGLVFMALSALGEHNLSLARQRLSIVPPDQAFSSDYRDADVMLTRLEASRDAALHAALACARTNSWTCMRTNADKAAAIDKGSVEAAGLLKLSNHVTPGTRVADRAPSAPATTHIASKRHERTNVHASARHHEPVGQSPTRKLEAKKPETKKAEAKKRDRQKPVARKPAPVVTAAVKPATTPPPPAPVINWSPATHADQPSPPRSKGRGEAH